MKAFFVPASAALLALLPAAATAAPPSWTVDKAKSRIGFSGTHAGNAFNGRFGQWTARIKFDPKDLAHSNANVVIATATAATGDNFQETSLKSEEWFDVGGFPTATFSTRRITAAGPGRYVAEGVLTIKNKPVPVRLPFTLKGSGNVLTMEGRTTVDRVALDIGAKSDASGQWVSKQIVITVSVTARRQ